jgi:hypothetical protein
MLGLLHRATRTRKPLASPMTSLFLERLEDRLSPSTGVGPPVPPAPSETVSLNVTYEQNKQVVLSGQLTNSSGPVAYEGINLSGSVSGSATTDSQGNYSVTLTATSLGVVSAASADGLSNIAQYTLVGGSPTISNFTADPLGGGLWEFSGSVSGAPTQGEVVNFGGINALQGQSVSVNADGSFDFYAIVNTGQGGWATAEAVDWWGDTSPIAGDAVTC